MKHILLAVSGMTPQIITETLFGIWQRNPSQLPTEIWVITSGDGHKRLAQVLLGADSPLLALCQDYHLPPILFDEQHILVPKKDGQPLMDIRTCEEQSIITDFITNKVRELTTDPEVALHASLAGGRKTMGFALGYAMSLFGRPQDALSHVLVSEPYENVPDFYYPTPTSVWRTERNKETRHDLSLAEVTLGQIPLVLMREEMPQALVARRELSYTQTVERINRANRLTQESASIELDFQRLALICDGYEVLLKPDCFAFYSWLAQDSKENPGEGIDAPRDGMRPKELDNRLRQLLRSVLPPEQAVSDNLSLAELLEQATTAVERIIRQDSSKPRAAWLLQDNESNRSLYLAEEKADDNTLLKRHKELWSRLLRETNKAIEEALGERLARYYRIVTVNSTKGENQRIRFDYKGVQLSTEQIRFR